jgi:hypothetical protein
MDYWARVAVYKSGWMVSNCTCPTARRISVAFSWSGADTSIGKELDTRRLCPIANVTWRSWPNLLQQSASLIITLNDATLLKL